MLGSIISKDLGNPICLIKRFCYKSGQQNLCYESPINVCQSKKPYKRVGKDRLPVFFWSGQQNLCYESPINVCQSKKPLKKGW